MDGGIKIWMDRWRDGDIDGWRDRWRDRGIHEEIYGYIDTQI